MDCIFCKIANKEIDSDLLYEDNNIVAFNDLNPQAPVHFLVIPKKHIESNDEIKNEDTELIGEIFQVIKRISKEMNLEDGYRIVNNCGENGGQTVNHLHYHVLGGRELQWPPG